MENVVGTLRFLVEKRGVGIDPHKHHIGLSLSNGKTVFVSEKVCFNMKSD